MGYENTTIHKVLTKMENNGLLLPAFQRKMVWDAERIERLMDSLMHGYPIGTFLFWEIERADYNKGEFLFYEFIRNYSEFDSYRNQPAPSTTDQSEVWAALDGQQRLTALYIAFKGTYAQHKRHKSWDNPKSFPKKALYLNLHYDFEDESADSGETPSFKFFEPEHVPEDDSAALWYRVSEITKFDSPNEVRKAARKLSSNDEFLDNVLDNMESLWRLERQDDVLNFFRSTGTDIDDVLEIFVRINSGAVTLSRSDLLLSTIVASWPEARDDFDDMLQSINCIGDGFRFNIDFVVRCTLACIGAPMQMKVRSFGTSNIESIKTNWTKIKSAISEAVNLASEFGFHARTLVAPNAMIPIVLYCFLNGKPNVAVRDELKKYLVIAQLNQVYGASADNALTKVNARMREIGKDFSMDSLRDLEFSGRRNFKFTQDDIDELLGYKKDSPYAFMVLSMLYPSAKTGLYAFHIDHMHPYSGFETERLKDMNLSQAEISDWQAKRDTVPNLHFLDAETNESKNATSLEEWMAANPTQAERITTKYCEGIPSYDFSDFESFYEARYNNMKKELQKLLID